MAIIISKNGKNAEKLNQSNFELEDKLQEYIYENPDTIPLYDIDEDTRLFIAAREFSTKSGPIDALGFDARGNIYVVETKLYKNPDKRTVVAQALDYGASLWRNATDFDTFVQQLDNHTQKQFNENFQDKYADFFDIEDATENIQAIRNNLADGVIKFVVLMDKLHDPLKDLVIFVNQNSKFDLYAVELEYYKHNEFEIIIPKLFGAEVKKEVTSIRAKKKSNHMTPATAEDFMQYVTKHYNDGEISETGKNAILELHEIYTKLATITDGTNSYWHAPTDYRDVIKFMVNNPDGKASMYLDSDSSIGAYPGDKVGLQIEFINSILRDMIANKIMKRTDKHLTGSRWFANFKSDYASDSEITKFIEINKKHLSDLHNTINAPTA